ncbi:MAG TPA: glycosyltransferase family 2 protein [Candidatus Ruthenibacterium merdigallinarum]|nr:glycosyltransferase family 2 protein [Candidatus Ruthenibacterium merdigallinarum]
MKILIIIPCYNEEENIERVVANLKQAAPEADYLIVNDCSTDRSAAICRDNGFSYVSLPVNLGIGGGVQCGYLYAREHGYDITVQMDGDGQHDPAYLHRILAPVADGTLDMCIGSRFIERDGFQSSVMRRVGINFLSALLRVLCGVHVRDVTSGFRACSKRLTAFYADHYAQDYPEPEAIITAVLGGYRVGEAPVVMRERMGGVSSISPFKSVYYMVKVSISLIVFRLTSHRRKGGERT